MPSTNIKIPPKHRRQIFEQWKVEHMQMQMLQVLNLADSIRCMEEITEAGERER